MIVLDTHIGYWWINADENRLSAAHAWVMLPPPARGRAGVGVRKWPSRTQPPSQPSPCQGEGASHWRTHPLRPPVVNVGLGCSQLMPLALTPAIALVGRPLA